MSMPALTSIEGSFRQDKPLAGWGILVHMHLTDETVQLGRCLHAGGGAVWYLPSNRNPSPPRVVERAQADGGCILDGLDGLDALPGETDRRFLVVEGNGRFFTLVHDEEAKSAFAARVAGISEHTSGGGHKVDRFDPSRLKVPLVAVYRDPLKGKLETGLGTSQSTVAALVRGFQAPLAGRQILVVGYGNVGSGLARSLAALGARVLVTDLVAERCLVARLAGFGVVSLEEGLARAEMCVTTTGTASVLNEQVLARCRDGLRVANVSNVPNEIDTSKCEELARWEPARSLWRTPSGTRFELLGGGLQVNHVVGSGNPSSLMDLSFSLHALVLRWLALEPRPAGVLPVPEHIRNRVASLALGI